MHEHLALCGQCQEEVVVVKIGVGNVVQEGLCEDGVLTKEEGREGLAVIVARVVAGQGWQQRLPWLPSWSKERQKTVSSKSLEISRLQVLSRLMRSTLTEVKYCMYILIYACGSPDPRTSHIMHDLSYADI